jgi:hypothetical protein
MLLHSYFVSGHIHIPGKSPSFFDGVYQFSDKILTSSEYNKMRDSLQESMREKFRFTDIDHTQVRIHIVGFSLIGESR